MWCPRPPRTSDSSARERKASATRALPSTGSFRSSCARWVYVTITHGYISLFCRHMYEERVHHSRRDSRSFLTRVFFLRAQDASPSYQTPRLPTSLLRSLIFDSAPTRNSLAARPEPLDSHALRLVRGATLPPGTAPVSGRSR